MTEPVASPSEPASAPALTGGRRTAFVGYQWLLVLFLVLGVVQVFLAGFGVFDLKGEELGSSGETALDPHRTMALVLGVIALVIFILACVARPGGRAIVLSFVLFLLTYTVQSILAAAGEDAPFFGGLHALDAFVILGLAGYLRGSAQRRATG